MTGQKFDCFTLFLIARSSEETRQKSEKKITDGDGKLLDDFRSQAKKMRFLAVYFAYFASWSFIK